MVFINTFEGAMARLKEIGTGKCKGRCKSVWIHHLRYALETKTNPLNLNNIQRKTLTKKVREMAKRDAINKHSQTLKKYKNRKSPPYPANQNCNKKMLGNDGNMYLSQVNKNGVCTWKKL